MSAKQRHYASILNETDIIMHQIERTYGPEKEADYNNICTLRNMAFVELVREGTPFIVVSSEDVIRMGLDNKTYDMPLMQFRQCVSEDEYKKLMGQKEFKPIDSDDKYKEPSRFDKLKEKLQEYQNGKPLQIEDEIAAMQQEMQESENAYRLDDIANSDIRKQQRQDTGRQSQPGLQNNFDDVVDMRISKRGIAKIGNTAEIGFLGLERGAGTTHTAIMFAQALASDGKSDVAFFEVNKHGHMMSMAAWITGETITKAFPMGKVDYYFGMSYLVFLSRYKDQYDYVVMDFGCDGIDDTSDFIRMNNRFIVASGADWNLPALEEFYRNYMFDRVHQMTYLIPFLDMEDVEDIRQNMRIENQMYPIPFSKNPFDIDQNTIDMILKICGVKQEEQKEKEEHDEPKPQEEETQAPEPVEESGKKKKKGLFKKIF